MLNSRHDLYAIGLQGPAQGLILPLLAKWNARDRLRTNLEDAARVQLACKMPGEDVEALIGQHIATEQATYLVEYFWLLNRVGCAAPDRMEAWIHTHNVMTAQTWAEILIHKTTRIAKLFVSDARRLQLQQSELVAELLGCLEKARRRIDMDVGCGEPSTAECLQTLDGAVKMLRELTEVTRPCAKHRAALAVLEARTQSPDAPRRPRRKRRLEWLLDEAYFGSKAMHACTARLDGTNVILGSSDIERFMILHMDPKLCRERLRALSKAGLLQERRTSENGCSVRVFFPTVQLEAAVADGLEPLHALHRHVLLDRPLPVPRYAS